MQVIVEQLGYDRCYHHIFILRKHNLSDFRESATPRLISYVSACVTMTSHGRHAATSAIANVYRKNLKELVLVYLRLITVLVQKTVSEDSAGLTKSLRILKYGRTDPQRRRDKC